MSLSLMVVARLVEKWPLLEKGLLLEQLFIFVLHWNLQLCAIFFIFVCLQLMSSKFYILLFVLVSVYILLQQNQKRFQTQSPILPAFWNPRSVVFTLQIPVYCIKHNERKNNGNHVKEIHKKTHQVFIIMIIIKSFVIAFPTKNIFRNNTIK